MAGGSTASASLAAAQPAQVHSPVEEKKSTIVPRSSKRLVRQSRAPWLSRDRRDARVAERVLMCVPPPQDKMDKEDHETNTLNSRMSSMSLSRPGGVSGLAGHTFARVQGSVAQNGTWLANQQRKATYQPFQPRPYKTTTSQASSGATGAETPSTGSGARAPLVSRLALGNVQAGTDGRTEPAIKSRPPSVSAVRKVPSLAPGSGDKPAAPARESPAAHEAPRSAAAPSFDLGQYDGGLERDEGKGRRNTAAMQSRSGQADEDILAMDSSMDGYVGSVPRQQY